MVHHQLAETEASGSNFEIPVSWVSWSCRAMTGFSGALNHPLYYPGILFTRLCFAADNFSLMISNFHWEFKLTSGSISLLWSWKRQTTDQVPCNCASMFLWVSVLHVLPTNCNWRTHKISAWRLGHHLVLSTLKISNMVFLILLTYNQAVVVSRFSYWRGLGVSS